MGTVHEIERYRSMSDDQLLEDLGHLLLEVAPPWNQMAASTLNKGPVPTRQEADEFRRRVGRSFWDSFMQAAKADICSQKHGLQEEISEKGLDVALAGVVAVVLSRHFGIGGAVANTLVAIVVVRLVRITLDAFCASEPEPT